MTISSEPPTTSWSHDPDVQLMLRAQSGDEDAFGRLVVRYQDRLIGIFSHLLHSQDAAEDLAQDVFLRVYRARERYRPTAKFSTWLFRIANNLASNKRRSLGRRKEVQMAASESGSYASMGENQLPEKSGMMPTRQLARQEVQDVVQEALNSLSDRQRMAVLLHRFEGMSYADIGTAMDLTPSAVKSLLSRARENLRARLEQHAHS